MLDFLPLFPFLPLAHYGVVEVAVSGVGSGTVSVVGSGAFCPSEVPDEGGGVSSAGGDSSGTPEVPAPLSAEGGTSESPPGSSAGAASGITTCTVRLTLLVFPASSVTVKVMVWSATAVVSRVIMSPGWMVEPPSTLAYI